MNIMKSLVIKSAILPVLTALVLCGTLTSRADIYLTYGNNSLGLFTDAGVLVRNVATNLSNPQGVAVDGSGNVFVADYGNKCVRMYDISGNFVRDVVSTNYSGGSTPSGLAVRANGQLIVTLNLGNDPAHDQFVTFNTAATDDWSTYNHYGTFGAGYRGGYFSTSQNRFYASLDGWVQYFDGLSLAYAGNAFPLGGASGITMDGSGNLYAVSYGGYITKWDGVNAQNYAFIKTGLNFPLGITYNSAANDLSVANYTGGNVQSYDLNGGLLGSFNVDHPAWLAHTTNTVHSVTVQTNLFRKR
jgi:hypothetical protein